MSNWLRTYREHRDVRNIHNNIICGVVRRKKTEIYARRLAIAIDLLGDCRRLVFAVAVPQQYSRTRTPTINKKKKYLFCLRKIKSQQQRMIYHDQWNVSIRLNEDVIDYVMHLLMWPKIYLQ